MLLSDTAQARHSQAMLVVGHDRSPEEAEQVSEKQHDGGVANERAFGETKGKEKRQLPVQNEAKNIDTYMARGS